MEKSEVQLGRETGEGRESFPKGLEPNGNNQQDCLGNNYETGECVHPGHGEFLTRMFGRIPD